MGVGKKKIPAKSTVVFQSATHGRPSPSLYEGIVSVTTLPGWYGVVRRDGYPLAWKSIVQFHLAFASTLREFSILMEQGAANPFATTASARLYRSFYKSCSNIKKTVQAEGA